MEGGIYAVYHCLKLMRESELPVPKSMLVSEGGATSALWRQVAADIMDVELTYMRDAKGAPTGDAINAGVGVGLFPNYDVARKLIEADQVHHPDPAAHATYERYFALYRKLYEDNKENYALLHALKDA